MHGLSVLLLLLLLLTLHSMSDGSAHGCCCCCTCWFMHCPVSAMGQHCCLRRSAVHAHGNPSPKIAGMCIPDLHRVALGDIPCRKHLQTYSQRYGCTLCIVYVGDGLEVGGMLWLQHSCALATASAALADCYCSVERRCVLCARGVLLPQDCTGGRAMLWCALRALYRCQCWHRGCYLGCFWAWMLQVMSCALAV
jgi:hypothetical protein